MVRMGVAGQSQEEGRWRVLVDGDLLFCDLCGSFEGTWGISGSRGAICVKLYFGVLWYVEIKVCFLD